MFHYCKFCVTHINKIYDKLMDIYVCAFFEIWLLKICQHTTAPQLSNTPKHHSMPCSIKGWFAHIYQYPTPSLHGPRLHFPSSLFIEHQPFRIWISVLFLNLDFSSLFFFASPFKISPQLYLITSQLSFSFILSNIQHPRVFFFPDHSFYGICFNACNHFS